MFGRFSGFRFNILSTKLTRSVGAFAIKFDSPSAFLELSNSR